MDIKKKLYNIYYTAQVGYGVLSFPAALFLYAGVAYLVIHSVFTTVSITTVTEITPIVALTIMISVGWLALKYGFYKQSQAFGRNANPQYLNWRMEFIKSNLDTGIANYLITSSAENKAELEKWIKTFNEFKPQMEELLK